MSSYTKLFNTILLSSIWSEPDHVRLVWITMLALKDRDGIIEASIPGLVTAAHVPLEKVQDAIRVLESKDEFSRSKKLDGRRIVPIDGGWQIVNHEEYRLKGSADEYREKNAQRVHRWRENRAKAQKQVEVASPTPPPSAGAKPDVAAHLVGVAQTVTGCMNNPTTMHNQFSMMLARGISAAAIEENLNRPELRGHNINEIWDFIVPKKSKVSDRPAQPDYDFTAERKKRKDIGDFEAQVTEAYGKLSPDERKQLEQQAEEKAKVEGVKPVFMAAAIQSWVRMIIGERLHGAVPKMNAAATIQAK